MNVTAGTRPLVASLVDDAEIAERFGADAEVSAMLTVEAELARAQAALGIIPDEAAAAIGAAVEGWRVDMAPIRRGMAKDGVPLPALVGALRAAVGGPHGACVHRGATSQDVVDTALMLRLRAVLAIVDGRLADLSDILLRSSAERGGTPLMAQTRMQAALPFTVADKIATWARPLESHRARLAGLAAALPIQLGGPIGDGGSFGRSYEALRAALAARLGLRDAPPWHSDRTPVLDVAQGLSLLSGTLAKIGQDIALLAQSEVGAVTLSGAGGSSAMAHKQNPVGAEVLVALGRFNAGMMGTLAQAMIHENERSGAAWTLEWMVLPQMAATAGAACLKAAELLSGLQWSSVPAPPA